MTAQKKESVFKLAQIIVGSVITLLVAGASFSTWRMNEAVEAGDAALAEKLDNHCMLSDQKLEAVESEISEIESDGCDPAKDLEKQFVGIEHDMSDIKEDIVEIKTEQKAFQKAHSEKLDQVKDILIKMQKNDG